jgi:hypothetical protein
MLRVPRGYGLVALVSMSISNHGDGAPGPSPLGTGESKDTE